MDKKIFVMSLILLGCGGNNNSDSGKSSSSSTNSSSSSSSSIENTIYSLEKINTLTLGEVYFTELWHYSPELMTGSGYATFYTENRAEKSEDGVLVIPQYTRFSKRRANTGSSFPYEESYTTAYYEIATRNLISYDITLWQASIPRSTVRCVSASPYHFPLAVKVGDADSTPAFSCNNNLTLDQGSWRTEDAGNGNLNLIVKSNTFDYSNNKTDETRTYTLDSQGNIVSFKIDELESHVFPDSAYAADEK